MGQTTAGGGVHLVILDAGRAVSIIANGKNDALLLPSKLSSLGTNNESMTS
jgi:hypothetical protein